jgi:hypothetical protein
MNLRDNPKLKGKWPPHRWQKKDPILPSTIQPPIGEQGVLKEVKGPWIHGPSGHLTLFIKYKREEYYGQIHLADVIFLQALFETLRECVRMQVHDIGSIDLNL